MTKQIAISEQGKCASCADMLQMRGLYVQCRSMKHARFMDICGATHYQDKLKQYHSMALLSAETIELACPSWKGRSR